MCFLTFYVKSHASHRGLKRINTYNWHTAAAAAADVNKIFQLT